MNAKTRTMDMANGPLLKNIFIFAVPLIFTNVLQMFFNSADTIIVGKFAGDRALAAVGSTGSIVFLITSLFNGLATGTNVVVARYIGTGNKEKIHDSVQTSIALAGAGGIILTFIGIVFAKVFLSMMSTPDDIIDLSATYMRIYFAGIIFLLLYNFGAAILRSKGDTQRPLYFLMCSGVLNIVLNFILFRSNRQPADNGQALADSTKVWQQKDSAYRATIQGLESQKDTLQKQLSEIENVLTGKKNK